MPRNGYVRVRGILDRKAKGSLPWSYVQYSYPRTLPTCLFDDLRDNSKVRIGRKSRDQAFPATLLLYYSTTLPLWHPPPYSACSLSTSARTAMWHSFTPLPRLYQRFSGLQPPWNTIRLSLQEGSKVSLLLAVSSQSQRGESCSLMAG